MSATKTIILRTIGTIDIGEVVGFQPSKYLNKGDVIGLARQVPNRSPVYGKAEIIEIHPVRKWVIAKRVS